MRHEGHEIKRFDEAENIIIYINVIPDAKEQKCIFFFSIDIAPDMFESSHGCEYEDYFRLVCDAVQSSRLFARGHVPYHRRQSLI